MSNLFDIAKKFPSYVEAKENQFLSIYADYFNTFKDKEINILEIGVAEGKSLNLWRKFFSRAKICGIDIEKMNFYFDLIVWAMCFWLAAARTTPACPQHHEAPTRYPPAHPLPEPLR